MTSVPPVDPRGLSLRRSARLLGVANAVISIVCATFVAVALTYLAERRFATGLWIILAVLGVRWALSSANTMWGEHSGAQVRAHWRATLVRHFCQPQPERERGRSDLALAIEFASAGPSLDLLETSAISALAGLAVLFWAGGWLALLITVALLGTAVPLYQRAGRRSEASAQDYQQRRAVLESRQLELLHHSTELRALGAVTYGANEIAAISDSEHSIAMRAIRVALGSSLVTEFLSGVSIGLVAMVVGFALLGGRISLQHALIAVLVTSEVFTHVRRYGVEFHRREDSERSLDILDGLDIEPLTSTTELLVARELVTRASDVPVTFVLGAGQRVLVSGPSGSGKTTLLQTLLGWRVPSAGSVARTGKRVGHVSVESSLVSGTLRENLTLGRDIDDDDVLECLASLGLGGGRFEDLATPLLPDGKGISTGEKVRLVLARALLAQPVLLVLDDVAGVLDDEGRRLVRDVLTRHVEIGIVEATVDTPVLTETTQRIEMSS